MILLKLTPTLLLKNINHTMNIFKSKIDLSLLVSPAPMLLSMVIQFYNIQLTHNPTNKFIIFILIILTFLFLFILIFTTKYFFINDTLHLKFAYIVDKSINVSAIYEIKYFATSFINSYSLSRDKIEIFYDNHKSIVISPKDKDGFIAEIQLINPNVVINYY